MPGPAQIRGLGLLYPHAPATCIVDWLECCKNHLVHANKQRESIREVFPGSPFCLAKHWQVFLTSAKWSSSNKAAVYGGAWSSPAVDLRRFEELFAWCRHDKPASGTSAFPTLVASSTNTCQSSTATRTCQSVSNIPLWRATAAETAEPPGYTCT